MADNTKKYEIVKSDGIVYRGKTLYRIRALRAFTISKGVVIKVGDIGGFVESENNLSQEGVCWLFHNSKVYGNAKVSEDALIFNDAEVFGYAEIFGNARIYNDAKVSESAKIYGKAEIYSHAKIHNNAKVYDDAQVCGKAEISAYAKIYGKAQIYGNAKIYGIAEIKGNVFICGDAKVCDEAKVFGDAVIYDEAVLRGSSQVYGRVVISDKACIFGKAKIFGDSKISDDVQIYGDAEICDLELKAGEYIHGSKEITTLLNEIERLKEKISLVKKVAKANFPMEKGYVESLSSKVKEYTKIYYAALERNTTISPTLREKYLPILNEIINEDSKLAELKSKGV